MIYDGNGNVLKSFKYNSLDSSSKFYSESEYAENGKVTAEFDESGENKTKLEYVDGTSVVRTQTLPNGSKFSYGHDENDTVTAITQSTASGEENSTQIAFTCGEVTELRSGNNKVNYEYDYKGRKTAIDLNGTKDYVRYQYDDVKTNGVKTGEKITANMANWDIIESEQDLRGNVFNGLNFFMGWKFFNYKTEKLKKHLKQAFLEVQNMGLEKVSKLYES